MKILTENLKKVLKIINYVIVEDSLRPLTGIIEMVADGNKLIINSSDFNNYINITIDLIEPAEFKAVIKRDKLITLVNATTKDIIEFNLKDKAVHIKGNGKYKLPLITEDGENTVKYPQLAFNIEDLEGVKVDKNKVKNMEKFNGIAVKLIPQREMLYNYYQTNDYIVTGDGSLITFSKGNIFKTDETITPKLIRFISVMDNPTVYSNATHYYLEDSNIKCKVYRFDTNFPISIIEPFTKLVYTDKVELNLAEFKDVLKRLSIFADNLEMSPITMEFKDKLILKIVDKGGEVLIEESINVSCVEYKCLMSLDILNLITKTLTGETFTLFYNSENSIAFEIPEVKIIAGLRLE